MTTNSPGTTPVDFDVIVVGAGVAGLPHRLPAREGRA